MEAIAAPQERASRFTPSARRELKLHLDRGGLATMPGASISAGFIIVAVGISVLVFTFRGSLQELTGIPPWMLVLVGGATVMAGIANLVPGFAGLRVDRRRKRLRPTHMDEPWIWDHPWNEAGVTEDLYERGRVTALWGMCGFFTAAVPSAWLGFFAPKPIGWFAFFALFFVCLGVLFTTLLILHVATRAKYGVSTLRFGAFPMRTGSDVELRLARPVRLAGVESPEATLHCVEERYVRRGNDVVVVADELWAAKQSAELHDGEYVWRITVPAQAPGTALSEDPRRYWELKVIASAPGLDYAAIFLVPIYKGRRQPT